MSIYSANNPNNPSINKTSPTDIVPTVTSNTPVTGVPSDVSGILTLGEVVGVGVGLGTTLAFTLGEGEGDGEGDFEAAGDGDTLGEGEELDTGDVLGIGEAVVPPAL